MNKLLVSTLTVLSAASLFATEYAAVSFAGAEKYADGSDVPDGEMHALVWTADGIFEGLDLDGNPVDANDKVVFALPLKKGEGVIVNLESDSPFVTGGSLAAYLVDTRTFGEAGATVAGSLSHVNATTKLNEDVKVSTGAAPSAGAKTETVEAVASAVPEDMPMPKITNMELTADMVILTVADTDPRLNYAVQGGATPAVDGEVGAAKTGAGTIKLVYPKTSGGNFFKVIRK